MGGELKGYPLDKCEAALFKGPPTSRDDTAAALYYHLDQALRGEAMATQLLREHAGLRATITELIARVAAVEATCARALAIAKGAAKMGAQHREIFERDGVAFCSATGCGAPTGGKDRCEHHADSADWQDAPDFEAAPSWVRDKVVR